MQKPIPPAGTTSDTGLTAYDGKSISHVIFCWNKALEAEKTATATYDRAWDWTIEKTADQSNLNLSPGQTFTPVNYTVTVNATSSDGSYAVEGTITIENPNKIVSATITEVVDVINQSGDEIPADVDCGGDAPYTLAPGGTLTCTYAAALDSKTNGTNTVTVLTSGTVPGGTAQAAVTFGAPTSETDECVSVSDTLEGTLDNKLCQSGTFKYPRSVGPYDTCGDHTVDNTASFETNDTGTTGSDSHTINVTVPCQGGCTLTQGYWKTHSEKGPAPYDDTWAKLPNGASTEFSPKNSQTYYQVLWTPPQGNAYYNLAHQYIAAVLNGLNGADDTAVTAALADAKTLLDTYTPAQIAALKGNDKLRAQFLALAAQLDKYNNGQIGPGHCSEDGTSTTALKAQGVGNSGRRRANRRKRQGNRRKNGAKKPNGGTKRPAKGGAKKSKNGANKPGNGGAKRPRSKAKPRANKANGRKKRAGRP